MVANKEQTPSELAYCLKEWRDGTRDDTSIDHWEDVGKAIEELRRLEKNLEGWDGIVEEFNRIMRAMEQFYRSEEKTQLQERIAELEARTNDLDSGDPDIANSCA